MKYIKLEWFHNIENEPILIYSEINQQRYELRKIEIFNNGNCIKYGVDIPNTVLFLADFQFPQNIEEINGDNQFNARYISKEEFEQLWNS